MPRPVPTDPIYSSRGREQVDKVAAHGIKHNDEHACRAEPRDRSTDHRIQAKNAASLTLPLQAGSWAK
eukprot:scaffold67590_cov52-Phaeocystis_antarctica.AAC.5